MNFIVEGNTYMKKLLLLLAIMMLGLVSPAMAARNFTGVWRLSSDSMLANIDTMLSGAALITIRMEANKLTLVAEALRIFDEYVIDGEDHRIDTRLGPMTYATSWEGDILVVTRTPMKKSFAPKQTLRFSVSPNMLFLQITCTYEGDKSPRDILRWEKR